MAKKKAVKKVVKKVKRSKAKDLTWNSLSLPMAIYKGYPHADMVIEPPLEGEPLSEYAQRVLPEAEGDPIIRFILKEAMDPELTAADFAYQLATAAQDLQSVLRKVLLALE